MFVNNINPDLVNIGPFTIRFYGIVYALGFLLVAYILTDAAKKKRIHNLNEDAAFDLVIYAMISGLIGARIVHVLSDFSYYSTNFLNVFAIWRGGLAFEGGLFGALPVLYYYTKKKKIDFIKLIDTIAVPLPLIIAFGRIANYVNSENYGPAANVPWCVVFEKVDNICRHPSMLYEASGLFVLFFILLFLSRKSRKEGTLSWVFFIGYGALRFSLDFLRLHSYRIFGLAYTQIVGLLMIVFGILMLLRNRAKREKLNKGR